MQLEFEFVVSADRAPDSNGKNFVIGKMLHYAK